MYLEQEPVDHDQVPDSQGPGADALSSEEHCRGQRRAEDCILAKVEEGEAGHRLHGSSLIVCRQGRLCWPELRA